MPHQAAQASSHVKNSQQSPLTASKECSSVDFFVDLPIANASPVCAKDIMFLGSMSQRVSDLSELNNVEDVRVVSR